MKKNAHSAHRVDLYILNGERTAYISLYNIKLMVVFITEEECVYCAVQMKFSNMIHVKNSSSKEER
jgi:hypothetical protein